MARLVVVSNRVGVPDGRRRGPAGSRSRSARRCGSAAASGSAGAARSPTAIRRPRQDRRARQHHLRHHRSAQGRLPGILQRLRQPRAVADPALPARSRRILAPRSRRLSARQRILRRAIWRSCCRPDDVIWVHDYHLIPLAKALRERGHKNRIGFFLHIPCPPPEILTALPNHERLIPALGALRPGRLPDRRSTPTNFSRYLANECGLPARRRRQLRLRRTARCGSACFRSASRPRPSRGSRAAPSSSAFVREVLDSLSGRAMIIGVDRLDYSKGLARAHERLRALPRPISRTGAARSPICRSRRAAAADDPRIRRHGAAWSARRSAASTAASAKRPGRRCATSTALQPHRARRALPRARAPGW